MQTQQAPYGVITSKGNKIRIDYRIIEDLIPDGVKVLDLGCGDGELLAMLIKNKNVSGRGVEKSNEGAKACIARGVSVYHGDILEGLAIYGDGAFDFVILSQTLQETRQPRQVVNEMLRVGKKCIVSFPNFGHWYIRLRLLVTGKMPKSEFLPYEWYNTPNIHVLTIRDFKRFCGEDNIHIISEIYLSTKGKRVSKAFSNILSTVGIFLIERSS